LVTFLWNCRRDQWGTKLELELDLWLKEISLIRIQARKLSLNLVDECHTQTAMFKGNNLWLGVNFKNFCYTFRSSKKKIQKCKNKIVTLSNHNFLSFTLPYSCLDFFAFYGNMKSRSKHHMSNIIANDVQEYHIWIQTWCKQNQKRFCQHGDLNSDRWDEWQKN
jgi:hypothetical protein